MRTKASSYLLAALYYIPYSFCFSSWCTTVLPSIHFGFVRPRHGTQKVTISGVYCFILKCHLILCLFTHPILVPLICSFIHATRLYVLHWSPPSKVFFFVNPIFICISYLLLHSSVKDKANHERLHCEVKDKVESWKIHARFMLYNLSGERKEAFSPPADQAI